MAKIVVDVATYNALQEAMKRQNIELDTRAEGLTITKNDQLATTVDFRMITIRRDVANIASASYKTTVVENGCDQTNPQSFVEYVDELYKFVLDGTVKQKTETGWK